MAPTITVAIPLHASAPWVGNVVENVRNLPPAVTEILISDRTCADDAAEHLRSRLEDDPRVAVVAEPAGLGWADHFQLLVEEGAGDLFMWMPHDDLFQPSWIPTLVEALDTHPEAWLAYGRLISVEEDGTTPFGSWPPARRPGAIAGWGALRMMLRGEMGVPFRGLFRRREVLASGVRLAPVDEFHGVDMLWVFAVALQSAVVYDDRTVTRKRFHPASAYASWSPERPGDHERQTITLLRRYGPGGPEGTAMRALARLAGVKARLRPTLGPAWRRLTPGRWRAPLVQKPRRE